MTHTTRIDRLVAAFVVVAAVAAATGCSDRRAQDRFRWREIVSALVQSKRAGEGSVYLDLVRVMPFGWERFYVFPPYTALDDVEKALGFKWRAAAKTRINERDDITLLVFVIGHTVYEYIEQPRGEGDFSRLKPAYPYAPRDGYFEVLQEQQDGQQVFYFVEAQRYR